MFIQLSHHWWWLALRGIAAILFGMLALTWRGDTLGSFILLFGGFALVDGLLAILVALTHVAAKKRWWIVLHAFISIDIALYTFFWTESAATFLLYGVAAWALLTGLMELARARRLDSWIANEGLLYQSGIASISFAVLLLSLSTIGALSLRRWIGPAAIIFGLLTLVLSLNVRNMGELARVMRQR